MEAVRTEKGICDHPISKMLIFKLCKELFHFRAGTINRHHGKERTVIQLGMLNLNFKSALFLFLEHAAQVVQAKYNFINWKHICGLLNVGKTAIMFQLNTRERGTWCSGSSDNPTTRRPLSSRDCAVCQLCMKYPVLMNLFNISFTCASALFKS